MSKRKQQETKDHGRIKHVEGEEEQITATEDEKGQKLDAFNLKQENEEGYFDGSGNFVWNRQEQPVQEDAWLDDMSDSQIQAAKRAKTIAMEKQKRNMDADLDERKATEAMKAILQPQEMVLDALKRLGSKRRGSKKSKVIFKQTALEREQFDRLTDAADFFMRHGLVDIYQSRRESFIPTGKAKPSAASKKKGEVQWEYKAIDGSVYGPFGTSDMLLWINQGYFVGESAVLVRRASAEEERTAAPSAEEELINDFDDDDNEGDWTKSDEIDFSKFS